MGTNRFGLGIVPCIRLERRGETIVDNAGRRLQPAWQCLGYVSPWLFRQRQRGTGHDEQHSQEQGIAPCDAPVLSFTEFKEREYDHLASVARSSLDMELVYRILRGQA